MDREKSSPKKMIVTNLCIIIIILFVYVMAFTSLGTSLLSRGPMLKGNTGQKNVALQIKVDSASDVDAYLDLLDAFKAKCTFFFCEEADNEDIVQKVIKRGHETGYYSEGGEEKTDLYLGGGKSIPVMSFANNAKVFQVSPSIDINKLKKTEDWEKEFAEKISNDMFIYINADNNFDDFEKIIQIVRNKGYTILKIAQML